jgi:hypothetical protein
MFKVWTDANSNGVADAGELQSLSDAGITSIGLVSDGISYTAANGDVLVAGSGTYTRADGSTGVSADACSPRVRRRQGHADQKGEDMKRKHWTMIVPGAVLLCASPAFGVELRDAVQAALNTNPEIRQAVAQQAGDQGRAGAGRGPVVSARFGRRLGRRSQAAQPDPPRSRHRRRDAVADRRRAHRRSAAVDSGGREAEIRARRRAPTPPRRGSRSAANSSRSTSAAPTSTICCSSGWSRSRRTMRRSTSGSPATFAKASPRARSASPTSSRPKSGCSRRAPGSPRPARISIPRRSSSRR